MPLPSRSTLILFTVLITAPRVLAAPQVASQGSDAALEAALAGAGDHRAELETALGGVPEDQRAGMAWLITQMPQRDRTMLSAEFLVEHCTLAYAAWEQSPWFEAIPEDVFLDAILPYASINERRDAWRRDFADRFTPLVKEARTASEAAALLNQKIFPLLGVKYSTGRPKADQSPYESIDAGLASCTGLSLLLIDACRAVGVPARFVGTPLWSDGSGNHSWVETYDDGGWHFTGAAEPNGMDLDKGWFTGRAAKASRDDPRNAIYAVTWRSTPIHFPMVWRPGDESVRAVDVTDRYKAGAVPLAEGMAQVRFRVQDEDGVRRAAEVEVTDAEGEIVFEATSRDERFDANDHLEAHLPRGATLRATAAFDGRNSEVAFEVDAAEVLVDLVFEPTEAAKGEEPGVEEEVEAERREASATPVSWNPETVGASHAAAAALKQWLRDGLEGIETQDFASTPLTRTDAAKAADLLRAKHREHLRAERAAEVEAGAIERDGVTMRFSYETFGKKFHGGRSLYLSMHGGGNAKPEVNDRQWENQKRLYEPNEGIYLAPRAPTNSWNLWHEAHIDGLFDRLIEDLIAVEDVNPDRVYLMGYSAGGDGVYQLAPRMADRFAAAAMMAGHPNETRPEGLRNLPFTLQMGGKDDAYDRNEIARKWKGLLADLHHQDPDGYEHLVEIHEDKGHWMSKEDAVAVPWMAGFTRELRPERIVWVQDDVTHERFYWLRVDDPAPRERIVAERVDNEIALETSESRSHVWIRLDDDMLDLDTPVTVLHAGSVVFDGIVPRTIAVLWRTLEERGDPRGMWSAEVKAKLAPREGA